MRIDIEGPYSSEVVIDILRASGWTSRIHWPNHRSPKMYQAHPSALAPMIATTAITIDKIASLRMALPTTVAGREARPPENQAGILHRA